MLGPLLQNRVSCGLVEASLRLVESRLAALEKDDELLREIFGNDVYRLKVRLHLLAAERAVLESEVDELVARQEMRWDAAKPVILNQQQIAGFEREKRIDIVGREHANGFLAGEHAGVDADLRFAVDPASHQLELGVGSDSLNGGPPEVPGGPLNHAIAQGGSPIR